MELKWKDDSDKRISIQEPGLAATLHLRKGDVFAFPDALEKVMRKKFSDDLYCGRCEFSKPAMKEKVFVAPKATVEEKA